MLANLRSGRGGCEPGPEPRAGFGSSQALQAPTSAPPLGRGQRVAPPHPHPGVLAGDYTPAPDPGPTSQYSDPPAPRAVREALIRGGSPAASPLCGPLARTTALGAGGSRKGGSPLPRRSAVERTWLSRLSQLRGGAVAALAPPNVGAPPAEGVTRVGLAPGEAGETVCRQRFWRAAPSWVSREADERARRRCSWSPPGHLEDRWTNRPFFSGCLGKLLAFGEHSARACPSGASRRASRWRCG